MRGILKKHEPMWIGQFGDINVSLHPIEFMQITRKCKSATYLAGHKIRELELSVINKQLAAGFIKPAYFAWATTFLFVAKKDAKLRFCTDYRKQDSEKMKD